MGQAPISGTHKHQYASGDLYQGTFEHSQRNGQGTMTYYNGNVYTGKWSRDQRHGLGEMVYSKSDEVAQTQFDHEELPQYIPSDPNSLRYRAWKRGQLYLKAQEDAQGVFLGRYIGFWLNDARNSFGRFIYNNGDVYYGEFSQDQRQGLAILVSALNNEFAGQYQKNTMSGWGVMKFRLQAPDAVYKETIANRVEYLEACVMENLYKQLKIAPNAKYKALFEKKEKYQGYITLINKPPQQVQNTQTVGQLIDYAASTEMVKQQKIIQIEDLAIENGSAGRPAPIQLTTITHAVEIEGFWVNNQLSGPLEPITSISTENAAQQQQTEQQQQQQPGAKHKSPHTQGNLNGHAIYRRYIKVTKDMDVHEFLSQNPPISSHLALQPHECYYTIIQENNVEYLTELRVLPVALARRCVETYGNVDVDHLIKEMEREKLECHDDQFDDLLNDTDEEQQLDTTTTAIATAAQQQQLRADQHAQIAMPIDWLDQSDVTDNNKSNNQQEQQQPQPPPQQQREEEQQQQQQSPPQSPPQQSPQQSNTSIEEQIATQNENNNNNNNQQDLFASQSARDALQRAAVFDNDFDNELYAFEDDE